MAALTAPSHIPRVSTRRQCGNHIVDPSLTSFEPGTDRIADVSCLRRKPKISIVESYPLSETLWHPMTPQDLQRHNCLMFNFRRSRLGGPFRHKGRAMEQPVGRNLQVNNGETMRQVALAGVGVAS
jgi:DNA-binding transcriptional LysR family regulator